MRSQADRDAMTTTIAVSLTIFLAAMLLGVGLVVLLDWTVGVPAPAQSLLLAVVLVVAVVASGRYLLRRRRP